MKALQARFSVVIAAIVAFGLLQIAPALGRGLSLDEPFVANAVHLGWSQMMDMVWRHETPLYHILLKGWVSLFGESEIALRSLSAFCFALAVGTVGYTAQRLGGVRAGYLAAFLMSVSQVGLRQAGMARMYALLSLQVALAGLVCFRLFALFEPPVREPRAAARILLCISLVALNLTGLLNHSIYFFFMCACNLAALLVSWRLFWTLAACTVLSLALHLGLWAPKLYGLAWSPATAWMTVPTFGDLKWAVFNLWGKGGTLMLAACLLAFSLLGWRGVKRFLLNKQGMVCVTLLAVLIFLPFAVSQFKPVFYAVRTPALFLPVACVMVALLVAHLDQDRWLAPALLLLAVGSVWACLTAPPLEPGARSGREGVQWVVHEAQCGDTVISVGYAINEVTYYLRRMDSGGCIRHEAFPSALYEHPGWLDFEQVLARPAVLAQEAGLLAERLLGSSPGGAVWVFYQTDSPAGDVLRYLKAQLEQRMVWVDTLDLGGSFFNSVLVYSPHPPSCSAASPVFP